MEEHSIIGGLGSAVAEMLMEGGAGSLAFKRIGTQDTFGESATVEELLTVYGLQPVCIASEAIGLLRARVAA